jgi:hypothetical protein
MGVVRLSQVEDRRPDHHAVEWASYGEVLQASSRIMGSITHHVTALFKTKAIRLPLFMTGNVQDRKYVLFTCFLEQQRQPLITLGLP